MSVLLFIKSPFCYIVFESEIYSMETRWRADIKKPRLICHGQINQIKIISTKIGLYTRFNRGPHTIYGYNVISLWHIVFTSLSPCFYRLAVYHVVMLLSSICIILRNIGSTKDTYVSVYGNTILGVNGDGSHWLLILCCRLRWNSFDFWGWPFSYLREKKKETIYKPQTTGFIWLICEVICFTIPYKSRKYY